MPQEKAIVTRANSSVAPMWGKTCLGLVFIAYVFLRQTWMKKTEFLNPSQTCNDRHSTKSLEKNVFKAPVEE